MARCAVCAPSGRKVFRRLYRRGRRGAPSLPAGFRRLYRRGRRGAPSLPARIPAALPPGTARRAVPTRQDSGGFTAGDGAAHRPYPARFRRLYRRGRRGAPSLPGKIPAALPPGTARRAVPTTMRLASADGRDGALRRLRPKRAQHLPAALPPGTARRAVPTCSRTAQARCPYHYSAKCGWWPSAK